MKRTIFFKEIKELLRSKTTVFYFIILSTLLAYSFYTAVDLYSKASLTAIKNPIYATGFEPVQGVFKPSLGAIFIMFSMLSPFVFTLPISKEKRGKTIYLLLQLKNTPLNIFLAKYFSGVFIVFLSLFFVVPEVFFWKLFGGHIPSVELALILLGYFLFGLTILSFSYLSSSIFESKTTSVMVAFAFSISSWFIDFGKEMYIHPVFEKLSQWTLTSRLDEFEKGILSTGAVSYFILLSFSFTFVAYIFFSPDLRGKIKKAFLIIVLFAIVLPLLLPDFLFDLSESGKNSFSREKVEFLKSIPELKIKVFLEPTDSRYRDYENDFLRKLKVSGKKFTLEFGKGKELEKRYGEFLYSISDKSEVTYSTNEYEIFKVFEKLSGKKLKKEKKEKTFKGYPLVVKVKWFSYYVFVNFILLILILLPPQLLRERKIKLEVKDEE